MTSELYGAQPVIALSHRLARHKAEGFTIRMANGSRWCTKIPVPEVWRFLAGCAAVLALLALIMGTGFALAALLGGSIIGLYGIAHSRRRWEAGGKGVWGLYALALALFLASNALKYAAYLGILEASLSADILESAAYVPALVATLNLGGVTNPDRDPSAVIDAWIITGGVYAFVWISVLLRFVQDESQPFATRTLGVVSATLALGLVFAIARVAGQRAMRNPAALILAGAAAAAVGSEAFESSDRGTYVTSIAFAIVALAGVGVAAAHPASEALTRPVRQGIARLTAIRAGLLTLAVLAGPSALAYEVVSGGADVLIALGLVGSTSFVSLLVTWRLVGVARARERAAQLDALLVQSASDLAQSIDEMSAVSVALKSISACFPDATAVGLLMHERCIGKPPSTLSAQELNQIANEHSSHVGQPSMPKPNLLMWQVQALKYPASALVVEVPRAPNSASVDAATAAVSCLSLTLDAMYALQESAAMKVQRRLERDLHDDIQQRLVALRLRVNSATSVLEPGFSERVSDELGQAIEALRELAHGKASIDLETYGLTRALTDLAQQCPLSVEISIQEGDRSPRISQAVYFIACEALTNVVKHAKASTATIELRRGTTNWELVVEDNGMGNKGTAGVGMRNMTERAEEVGGSLEVSKGRSGGLRLVAHLPS